MELVIKIQDRLIKKVKDHYVNPYEVDEICEAILNGTPLPKHHGRLIDADEAIKKLKSLGNRDYRRNKGTIQEAEKMLSFDEYTHTIIEGE